MSFLVRVTHPAHNFSCSLEYATREHEADSPELAIQLFQAEAGPIRFDLCAANDRLFDGGKLEWKDRYTGKTGSIEEAAETFESEVSRDLVTYDVVLEALQGEGTFQYEDDETGRIFEVRELVGAVA